MSGKKPKTKILTGSANLSTSKVNSQDQCVTLTYTIKNIKKSTDVQTFEKEIPSLIDVDVTFDLILKNHTTSELETVLKVKTKSCENEEEAHELSEILDKYIKKKGGQTTLDEGEED